MNKQRHLSLLTWPAIASLVADRGARCPAEFFAFEEGTRARYTRVTALCAQSAFLMTAATAAIVYVPQLGENIYWPHLAATVAVLAVVTGALAALSTALKQALRLLGAVADAGFTTHLHEIAATSPAARAYLSHVAHTYVHFRVFDYKIACKLAGVPAHAHSRRAGDADTDAVWMLLDTCLDSKIAKESSVM